MDSAPSWSRSGTCDVTRSGCSQTIGAAHRGSRYTRMTLIRTFPSGGVLARPARNRAADVIVFVGGAALLWLIVRVAHGTTVPWTVENAPSTVSTDPAELPYYAARSLLRMFVALAG